MSLTKEAIEHIQHTPDVLERIEASIVSATTSDPLIPLPPGYQLKDVSDILDHRNRQKGVMKTALISSFVEFCKTTNPQKPACFIDHKAMRAVAIFNYGDGSQPGHCDFAAELTLEPTAEYADLKKAVSTPQYDQLTLVHFLEDMDEFVTAYDSYGSKINFSHAISAIRKMTINAQRDSTHEHGEQLSSKSILENIEAKAAGSLVLPSMFSFSLNPYVGLGTMKLDVRLLSHLSESTPKLSLKFIRHEQAQHTMANDLVDILDGQLRPFIQNIYVGSFFPAK